MADALRVIDGPDPGRRWSGPERAALVQWYTDHVARARAGCPGGDDQVLTGEVLAPGIASDPCKIEQWYAGGWYRWRCTATDHQGSGEDRTEDGRARALQRHAEYVAAERAAGTMTGFAPVDVDEVQAWPGTPVRQYAQLATFGPAPVDVDAFTDRPSAQRAAAARQLVAFLDRPAEADDDWWRSVAYPGAVIEVTESAGGPVMYLRVVEAAPVDGGARLRVVAEE